MEQPQNTISNSTILSALAGIMFFGPFIKIPEHATPPEKSFLQGYTKIWKINLGLFTIVIICAVINYFSYTTLLEWINYIGCGSICMISIVSIFMAINGIPITEESSQESTPLLHKEQIIKSFLPVYNLDKRYALGKYQTPYRRLKESILRRSMFSYGTLLLGITAWMIILALIIIRMILLLMSIDILPNSLKKIINQGFSKQPEELTAYLTWPIKAKIKKTETPQEIITTKQEYMDTQPINLGIILQYLSFIGIIVALHYHVNIQYNIAILAIAILILLSQFLLYYKYFKRLPNIPLLADIRNGILK